MLFIYFFFSSRRRHTRCSRDWSSDVCSSDLPTADGGVILRMGCIAVFHQVSNGGPYRGETDTGAGHVPEARASSIRRQAPRARDCAVAVPAASRNLEVAYLDGRR